MGALDNLLIERDELKSRVSSLVALLKESHEAVGIAVGVELEYGDYPAAERFKDLRLRIEREVKSR
jgi:hypothetical protein